MTQQFLRWVFVLLLVAGVGSAAARAAAQATECSSFDTQIWAQSVYDTNPTQYAALDPDGNGIACEALPDGIAPASWTDAIPADAVPAQIVDVSDGDTIHVMIDGQRETIRLILIDTPETHRPNAPAECFGQDATTFAKAIFALGGQLYLEKDVSETDRYGRLLRYAWLDFGNGRVYLVDEAMVRAGYAALYTYPPDVKYVEQIREAQRFAREHGYGLWSQCQTTPDGDTNDLTGSQPAAPAPAAPSPPAPAPSSGQSAIVRAEGPFVGPAGPIVRIWFADGTWQDVPLVLGPPPPVPQGSSSTVPSTNSEPPPAASAVGNANGTCDPSYPGICLPSPPPQLTCADIALRNFIVLPPDPHHFDVDGNGFGCEQR